MQVPQIPANGQAMPFQLFILKYLRFVLPNDLAGAWAAFGLGAQLAPNWRATAKSLGREWPNGHGLWAICAGRYCSELSEKNVGRYDRQNDYNIGR